MLLRRVFDGHKPGIWFPLQYIPGRLIFGEDLCRFGVLGREMDSSPSAPVVVSTVKLMLL